MTIITGWAVTLTCYTIVPITGKWQILTPQGAKTPEPNLMKLGMVDYVWDPTPQQLWWG